MRRLTWIGWFDGLGAVAGAVLGAAVGGWFGAVIGLYCGYAAGVAVGNGRIARSYGADRRDVRRHAISETAGGLGAAVGAVAGTWLGVMQLVPVGSGAGALIGFTVGGAAAGAVVAADRGRAVFAGPSRRSRRAVWGPECGRAPRWPSPQILRSSACSSRSPVRSSAGWPGRSSPGSWVPRRSLRTVGHVRVGSVLVPEISHIGPDTARGRDEFLLRVLVTVLIPEHRARRIVSRAQQH